MNVKYRCRKMGCSAILDRAGWCEHHQPTRAPFEDVDKNRPSAAKRGYGSLWRLKRYYFLVENPLCAHCQAPATLVDHIQPHKGDQDLFWNEDNWQGLCKSCHARKTWDENRRDYGTHERKEIGYKYE